MAMSTARWHADDKLLRSYTAGGLDVLPAASVEQHLIQCDECRRRMAAHVDVASLQEAWTGVRERIEVPALPLTARIAVRLGVPEPSAVLLAASVSLRTAWLSASAIALGFAWAAAQVGSDGGYWIFLLIAPLLPVLGVAMSYAPSEGDFEPLTTTTPYGRSRLVFLRTVAVVAGNLPLAAVLGLLLPGPAWIGVAWLGPALLLIPVVMLAASFVGPYNASAAVSLGWCAVVALAVRQDRPSFPVEPEQQLLYVVLAAGSVIVLMVRRDRLSVLGDRA
jgi:hypothetical protein